MPVRRLLVAVLAVMVLPSPAAAAEAAPLDGRDVVMSGLYSDQWYAAADIGGLAAVTAHAPSLAGTFHELRESEDGWVGTTDWVLEEAWRAQTTPLANVNVKVSAAAVAAGAVDADIRAWAGRVRQWLGRGEGRSLLVAPMQEMNGDWVPYGMDPASYREAFRRFVSIFREEGLDERVVRWVFAPNGWSTPPYRIADYYPGDDVVDLLGVSSYNFGAAVDRWSSVYEVVTSAVVELQAVSPYKPILLTQVGSSTAGGDRDAWLRELFAFAAAHRNVVGLVYFNFIKETDWKVWEAATGTLAAGWAEGVASSGAVHRWPLVDWFQPGPLPFTPYDGAFADDDASPLQADIEWLASRGLASGCAPHRFCPYDAVTRGEAAAFLVRALALPPSTVDHFTDDNGTVHEASINALAAAGVTAGCDLARFCPDQPISRQQLASFLAEALGLQPDPQGPAFLDTVDPAHRPHVAAVAASGISSGCGPDSLCAWDAVARQDMAVMLRRALELREPPPPPAPPSPPAPQPPRRWWAPHPFPV